MNQESSSLARFPKGYSFSNFLQLETLGSFVWQLCWALNSDRALADDLLKAIWIIKSSRSFASFVQDLLMNFCGALKKRTRQLWHDVFNSLALLGSHERPVLTAYAALTGVLLFYARGLPSSAAGRGWSDL